VICIRVDGFISLNPSAGAVTKTYGWLPGNTWGTDPVYMQSSGQRYWYVNDRMGTPRALTDAYGRVVWSARYEAYGSASVNEDADGDGISVTSNLRLPGQYFDAETGYHYNWNRYYDPQLGRYTQTDPIGFKGKDTNLYRYVYNYPVGARDPKGLDAEFEDGWDDPLPGGIGIAFLEPYNYNDPSNSPWVQRAGDLASGFADTITFGGTDALRDWAGTNPYVNKCSGYYTAGEYAGDAWLAAATSSALSKGAKYLNRPYWRYYDGDPADAGKWMTRGKGFEPPYKTMEEASDMLQIRDVPIKVKPVKVPWYEPVRGPRPSTNYPKYGRVAVLSIIEELVGLRRGIIRGLF